MDKVKSPKIVRDVLKYLLRTCRRGQLNIRNGVVSEVFFFGKITYRRQSRLRLPADRTQYTSRTPFSSLDKRFFELDFRFYTRVKLRCNAIGFVFQLSGVKYVFFKIIIIEHRQCSEFDFRFSVRIHAR